MLLFVNLAKWVQTCRVFNSFERVLMVLYDFVSGSLRF